MVALRQAGVRDARAFRRPARSARPGRRRTVSALRRNSSSSAASCASDSASPCRDLARCGRAAPARASARGYRSTLNACPVATMPMTRRSTPGVSGPRSTRSPTKTALRFAGGIASTARPSSSRPDVVAQLGEQLLQLGAAAVHVADHVERAGLVPQVVEQPLVHDRRVVHIGLAAQHVDALEALLAEELQRPRQRRRGAASRRARRSRGPGVPRCARGTRRSGCRGRSRRRARSPSWRPRSAWRGRAPARWSRRSP